ncbi:peptidoglycan biosynthesis protein MviN/MurJ (putative lipid II flippase) [Ewingella americana]
MAACLNAALLYWQLRKQDIFQPQPGWHIFLIKLFVAVLAMSAALLGMMYVMPAWDVGGMAYRLARLMAVVVVGVIAYFGVLGLLGFRVKEFARRLD